VSAGLISKNKEWRNLESQNHVVIHHGDEMLEIYSIHYNENTDSIKCFSRPFEGKPLSYYNKVLAKRSGNTKLRNNSSRRDLQQAHLFINSFDKLSGSEIGFSIKDISQVGVLKKDVGRNVAASMGVVSIVVVADKNIALGDLTLASGVMGNLISDFQYHCIVIIPCIK
jgi:hypothetical protein